MMIKTTGTTIHTTGKVQGKQIFFQKNKESAKKTKNVLKKQMVFPGKTTIHIDELHEKAVKTAKHYLRLEKELLELIIQIDKTKAFYRLGYQSLFAYTTEALKLSPATAYSFIKVARKSHEIPQLKKEVMDGKLSISKAQKMTQVLTKENHKKWFDFAEKTTHRKLEREVALASPKQSVIEKATYVPSGEKVTEKVKLKRQVPRVALQVGVSEKLMLKLRQAQDLESQKQRKSLDLEETLEALVEVYLNQRDPVRRARRQKLKGKLQSPVIGKEEQEKEKNKNKSFTNKSQSLNMLKSVKNSSHEELKSLTDQNQKLLKEKFQRKAPSNFKSLNVSESVRNSSHEEFKFGMSQKQVSQKQVFQKEPENGRENFLEQRPESKRRQRKPLPAYITHQVYLRDQGQCTYYDERGKRCSSKRFLEIHHKKPVSRGGDNSVGNLRLLCSGHHKVCHLSDKEKLTH